MPAIFAPTNAWETAAGAVLPTISPFGVIAAGAVKKALPLARGHARDLLEQPDRIPSNRQTIQRPAGGFAKRKNTPSENAKTQQNSSFQVK